MKTITYFLSLTVAFVLLGPVKQAFGMAISWTDWTSASSGNLGSASGTITLPDLSTVSVSYTGEVLFAQTGLGTNYWNPSTPYTSTTVSNPPPASEMIALEGGNATVNTITFSVPVVNPVMGIVSLGTPWLTTQYHFSTPFDILSSGPGFWGNGPLLELPGNILEGKEGHGTIQFLGTHTSISWTVPTFEHWHGSTFGITGSAPAPVPEPSTLLLLGSGLIGLVVFGKRKLHKNLE